MSGMIAPVIRKVEIISYHLTILSTLSRVTFYMLVAKKVVMNDATIPTAVIMSGK